MSLDVCIPDLLREGRITQEQADEMSVLFGEAKRHYRKSVGDAAAAALATRRVAERLEEAVVERERRTLLQVKAQAAIWADIQAFGQGAGGTRVRDDAHLGKAAEAIIARSEYAPYASLEYQARAVRGDAHATMADILQKHSRNIVGTVRDKAGLEDMVRALFGEDAGPAARELADAWSRTAEGLRERFNAAGGAIRKLDNWGLPQSHDADAIAALGFDGWLNEIVPRLDRMKMLDHATGLPFTDEALGAALRDTYEAIVTDGWSRQKPGAPGRGMMAKRHTDSRFLIFKSADDWLDYAERFGGKATPFDAMMAHIDTMSHEIAAMERLGPDPAATVRWLGEAVEKQATLKDRAAIDGATASAKRLTMLWDEYRGATREPVNRKLALGFSAFRALQSAAKLGGAVLSSVSDVATSALTRRFNDLPVMRGAATTLKLLNPANAADRALAIRAGLIAEEAGQMSAGYARLSGEELTGEVSKRVAEFVLRASGLNAITQARRWSFGMDALGAIADHRALSIDALPDGLGDMLSRNGIDAATWDRIRAAPLVEERGAQWLLPESIASIADRSALMRMIHGEMDFAVPVASLKATASVNAALKKGTVIGEIGRTAFQFKSFGVTLMLAQAERIMAQTGFARASYAAQMILFTTSAGALALQLKEIAKGRDPRPMTDWAFWGAAMAQGGGFGIWGDFLKSSQNRFGMGAASTFMGPGMQTIDTLGELTLGQAGKAWRGEKTNPGRVMIRALKNEMPGSSLWYTRLAFERLLLDEMSRQIDPDYADAWRRMERRAEETGQEYFWAPGDSAPARAPNLANALEEAPE